MKTKLFTFFLALVASVGMMFAESGTCGEHLTWKLIDSVLTISGTGAMTDWSEGYVNHPWCAPDDRTIKTVIIGDSVTSIGRAAFLSCKALTSVKMGNSITSIGDYAFSHCTGLTSVTIPNSVTSIGAYAFEDCYDLASVHISDIAAWCNITFHDSSVHNVFASNPLEYAHHLYLNDTEITDLVIPNSVTSIGDHAFYECYGLTSVTMGNNVESIGNEAFCGCSGLTSVTIPNSVTNIKTGIGVFIACSSLTTPVYNAHIFVYLPNSYSGTYTIPDGITQIAGSAFSGCSGLTSIEIPNSVTSIGDHAFYECDGLESITIPNSVTSIEDYAFYDCDGLKSITIPNSVISIGDFAFATNCNSAWLAGLRSVTIGNSVTSIGDEVFSSRWLRSITCMAVIPPTCVEPGWMNPESYRDGTFGGVDTLTCELYVLDSSVNLYKVAEGWKKFKSILPIGATDVDVTNVVVEPTDNDAVIQWPTVSGAYTYELVIKDQNGNIVCTLIFNAQGQLLSIDFNAPKRNYAPQQTQTAGFAFTVTGLDSGTRYTATIEAKASNGSVLDTKTVTFTTTGTPLVINNVSGESFIDGNKVIRNGQLFIRRGDEVFNAQGARVD